MIVTGTDLIEIDRITNTLETYGERFLKRIYTKHEIDFCNGKANSLAGRFAAKEAVMKALKSSGYTKPIPFKAIDIRSGDHGEPIIVLDLDCDGKCKVSISHTNTHAIASAIFISE